MTVTVPTDNRMYAMRFFEYIDQKKTELRLSAVTGQLEVTLTVEGGETITFPLDDRQARSMVEAMPRLLDWAQTVRDVHDAEGRVHS